MEFPSTGETCSEPSCKRLDFLPLGCSGCGLKFCSEHLPLHFASCLSSRTLGADELSRIGDVHVCSSPGCRERSVVPLPCDRCGKHLCLKHRHVIECESRTSEEIERERERYAEPVRRFDEAKAIVDKKVANSLAEAKKNPKTRSTATKIQLMKIKQKAVGPKTIPTTDRRYFNVTDPSGKTLAVFVSKNWTVGRCIDAIAEELRLVNHNNRASGRKLRLFREGVLLTGDMSSVVNGVAEDGDQLVMDYLEDS